MTKYIYLVTVPHSSSEGWFLALLIFTLMMEVISCFETPVHMRATRRYIREDGNIHELSVFNAWHRPPLWSSGQSSWLQIRRPGFDSRHYQIF
jgi:hypothetical protein